MDKEADLKGMREVRCDIDGVRLFEGYATHDVVNVAMADNSPGGLALLDEWERRHMDRYAPQAYNTRVVSTGVDNGRTWRRYQRYTSSGD